MIERRDDTVIVCIGVGNATKEGAQRRTETRKMKFLPDKKVSRER